MQKATDTNKYWQHALYLSWFTILYNLIEGLVSLYFGAVDEALTLFGFGIDSFIEVLSGVGILAMVLRIRRHPDSSRSKFERTALRITGLSFYLLAAGLGATAIYNIAIHHKPETTVPGLVIAIISILIMWALVVAKRRTGHALASAPILADANCTLTCVYMSIILLVSSFIYQLSGFGWIDSLGALGLIYFSISEGKESYAKAAGLECTCDE